MHPLIKHLLTVIGLGLAVFLGLLAIPLILLFVCLPSFDNLCGNSLLFEAPSPTGDVKALVFERSCGATTDFSTQVSLVEAKSTLPNEGGNVFIGDTDHLRAPSGPGGGPKVKVTWVGPAALRIEYHPLVRVIFRNESVGGVDIQYITTTRDI